MKFGNTDAAKTYAVFLPRLAEKAPRLVNKQMSLLIEHLDNEVCARAHARMSRVALVLRVLIRPITRRACSHTPP